MNTIVIAVLGFLAGAVFSYLFLRANPKKKASLDEAVNKTSK
jgi:hypothetical protein